MGDRKGLSYSTYYSKTPLNAAANNGHSDVVKLLLDARADPNVTNRWKESSLYLAARNGHTAIAKLLLGARADPNKVCDFETITTYGYSPLHAAAGYGHTEVVKLLLKAGASPNMEARNGETPLSKATKFRREEVVKVLSKAISRHRRRVFFGPKSGQAVGNC